MSHDRPARPLYARALRLRHLQPGGAFCFFMFEGMIGLALLLSLADLVTWWSVLVLPLAVAALVKINDVVAGAFAGSGGDRRIPLRLRPLARGVAPVIPAVRREARTPEMDAPTEVIPRFGFVRRRATNERRFAAPADRR